MTRDTGYMPEKRLPDTQRLVSLRERGLTQEQIVDWVEKETGQKVTRSAVSVALHRAGKTGEGHRYTDTLPWVVKAEHAHDDRAKKLRWLGRRRAGLPLKDWQEQRLNGWLARLKDSENVVTYVNRGPLAGWHYVKIAEVEDFRYIEDGVPIEVLPGSETSLARSRA